jgi:hypothetical protein
MITQAGGEQNGVQGVATQPGLTLVYTSGLPYNEEHEDPKSGGEETAHAVYQESRRPSFG